MKYRAKTDKRVTVDVTKQDEHYVWFIKDGIELVVSKVRFLKAYELIISDNS